MKSSRDSTNVFKAVPQSEDASSPQPPVIHFSFTLINTCERTVDSESERRAQGEGFRNVYRWPGRRLKGGNEQIVKRTT